MPPQCSETTLAQFWDSSLAHDQDEVLDTKSLEAKFSTISEIWFSSADDATKADGRFILISSFGNTAGFGHTDALRIRPKTLENLLEVSQLSTYAKRMLESRSLHSSRHLHYDSEGKPDGLTILVRCPPSLKTIVLAMRLRFADRACVCLLFADDASVLHTLRNTCIQQRSLLSRNPLLILTIVYEERKEHYHHWRMNLISRVREAETASGMIPATWAVNFSSERLSKLRDLDEPNLLNHMYAAHAKLYITKESAQWAIRYGELCLELVKLVERYRKERGHPAFFTTPQRTDFEESVQFTMGRWEQSLDLIDHMVQRLQAQINVVHSLITQRDSKVSRQIAEDSKSIALLAAQDSRTMKTIAIVTLLFLPATLTTGIWSASIFQLPETVSWKVFVSTTIGATLVSFAIWFITDRRPLNPPTNPVDEWSKRQPTSPKFYRSVQNSFVSRW
ncbi:hypothetical protein V8F20_002465 [Naviculisporaceae sp. PSN 640]